MARVGAVDFYTVGYQGRDIDGFLRILTDAGVAFLLDIRFNAVSMYKPAFSRRNLEAAAASVGIGYWHLPDLGVPSDVRAQAKASSRITDIWDWYEDNVVTRYGWNLHWFFNSGDHPLALMCVEREQESCHRHRLAAALGRQGLTSRDL